MRYIPALLNRLFKPVPLMDEQIVSGQEADPITRDVDAAVLEHELTGERERESYNGLRAAIDELLERIGSKH